MDQGGVSSGLAEEGVTVNRSRLLRVLYTRKEQQCPE